MESPFNQFCGKFSYERSINDFQIIEQSNLKETCFRHSKTRAFSGPVTGRWDEFIFEINEWSHPDQTKRLDLSYTFDIRQLPVSFDHVSETDGNQIMDHRTSLLTRSLILFEIQDPIGSGREIDFKPKAKESIKRDRHQMKRFVTLCHIFHEKYTEIQLSLAILTFIFTRCSTDTPIEIFQELHLSGINDADKVARYQISYQWHQTNVSTWRRDADRFLSATKLLDTKNEYQNFTFYACNVRGLEMYIQKTINTLLSRAKELAIDAMYRTNSSGMDLYVLLSELDGTGVPLCYLLVTIDGNNQESKSADSGAITSILKQFLHLLKTANFEPLFFHYDEDKGGIAAIKLIWPDAVIRLCLWHAKRAIRNKLKDNKKTRTQAHYSPYEAKALALSLEIWWGSHSTRRPDGHKYGRCECLSSSLVFEEIGSIETSNIPERDRIVN